MASLTQVRKVLKAISFNPREVPWKFVVDVGSRDYHIIEARRLLMESPGKRVSLIKAIRHLIIVLITE